MKYQSTKTVAPLIPHQLSAEAASTRPQERTDHKAVRVLVVESESQDADLLILGLRRHGCKAEQVRTGTEALQQYRKADLLLVDLDLPDLDGVELCRSIRAVCDVAIIVVTARDTELDRVLSLRAGADDYVVKPCSLTELAARIEAVMRRVRLQPFVPEDVITVGALHIDHRAREIRLDGRHIEATRKEFDLLYLLASRPGNVFSRRQIMTQVWSDPRAKPGRTIDTHVSSLRSKLGSSRWIATVRGVGFRFGPS
ncbi:response regulator transcription factor [Streptomyces sp. A3M-1-3]|uniref:response regulator transcription factor n=1 Tax=Streptomyces sp. A3M-1-3 TaxID=2962044 RepID=UPI0020B700AF|nr:response regulator transcription factor [Streptomyces sp. A3M-1-3]MCP3821486.1 response regulator transcription factor [Streptomyces sp. A3M-1-3]